MGQDGRINKILVLAKRATFKRWPGFNFPSTTKQQILFLFTTYLFTTEAKDASAK